jgi:ATP-dependent DNA helicase RecQ
MSATRNYATADIIATVKRYWGYGELRPLQEQAIRAGLEQRDSLVVLPTGGGKSLCYQVPAVLASRTDIVVSPLISLMKDQVDGLRECGYPAAALYSGMAPHAIHD